MPVILWCADEENHPFSLTATTVTAAAADVVRLIGGGMTVQALEHIENGRTELLATGDDLLALLPITTHSDRPAALSVELQVATPTGQWFTDRHWVGPDAMAEAQRRAADLGLPATRCAITTTTVDACPDPSSS